MSRFSHRQGYKELPPQLKLEEVSEQFKARVLLTFNRALILLSKVNRYNASQGRYLTNKGKIFFEDLWVKELRKTENINPTYRLGVSLIETIVIGGDFAAIFDLIEFTHEKLQNIDFENEIVAAFCDERLAYRFKGGEVIAVGTAEQAETIERAFSHLEQSKMKGAETHLKNSARFLAQGNYGDSVRESISAVESAARMIEPNARTLGEALNKIHKSDEKTIHPAMNEAFKKLYGYTSDTAGIRHSLLHDSIAPVSEGEALFMLGACSAFIPYLTNQQ